MGVSQPTRRRIYMDGPTCHKLLGESSLPLLSDGHLNQLSCVGLGGGIGAITLIMRTICRGLGRVHLACVSTTLTPLREPSDCSMLLVQEPVCSDL